jgi:hypothetical protein
MHFLALAPLQASSDGGAMETEVVCDGDEGVAVLAMSEGDSRVVPRLEERRERGAYGLPFGAGDIALWPAWAEAASELVAPQIQPAFEVAEGIGFDAVGHEADEAATGETWLAAEEFE